MLVVAEQGGGLGDKNQTTVTWRVQEMWENRDRGCERSQMISRKHVFRTMNSSTKSPTKKG